MINLSLNFRELIVARAFVQYCVRLTDNTEAGFVTVKKGGRV